MNLTDSLLISINFAKEKENTIMIVGRKPVGKPVDIVNAFQGEEAIALWELLTERKDKINKK